MRLMSKFCIASPMRRLVAQREQPAVDARMQRLHAAVHHLRHAGDAADVGHGEAGLDERLRRAAGGEDLDAALGKRAREVDDAGLVGDGDQRAPDLQKLGAGDSRGIDGARVGIPCLTRIFHSGVPAGTNRCRVIPDQVQTECERDVPSAAATSPASSVAGPSPAHARVWCVGRLPKTSERCTLSSSSTGPFASKRHTLPSGRRRSSAVRRSVACTATACADGSARRRRGSARPAAPVKRSMPSSSRPSRDEPQAPLVHQRRSGGHSRHGSSAARCAAVARVRAACAVTRRGPETICASAAGLEKRLDDSSFSTAVEWAAVRRAARRR